MNDQHKNENAVVVTDLVLADGSAGGTEVLLKIAMMQ
jgi:hypothetical protein